MLLLRLDVDQHDLADGIVVGLGLLGAAVDETHRKPRDAAVRAQLGHLGSDVRDLGFDRLGGSGRGRNEQGREEQTTGTVHRESSPKAAEGFSSPLRDRVNRSLRPQLTATGEWHLRCLGGCGCQGSSLQSAHSRFGWNRKTWRTYMRKETQTLTKVTGIEVTTPPLAEDTWAVVICIWSSVLVPTQVPNVRSPCITQHTLRWRETDANCLLGPR